MLRVGGVALAKGRERGQVLVLFAVLLPVFLGLGSIVVSIGNWYVHKKHLQTLVDAGALAGGTAFSGCFQNPITTNTAIADVALQYAGDANRNPTTQNQQVQQPNDVHALLNSDRYWAQGDATDDVTLRSTLDNTLGLPCTEKFLDVKATDDEAPIIWRWLPLVPSPKAKARVEIRQVVGLNGMLPWAVPEVDPERVAAVIVNEDFPATSTLSVRAAGFLNLQSGQPGVWAGDLMSVNLNGGNNFNTVIVVSRDPAMSLTGSLNDICTQRPVQTVCYAGGTSTSGMSFIRAYSGSASPVTVREFQLADATCGNDSAPYFVLEEGCRVSISRAVVDFGVSGDPTDMPTCARVSASPGGDLQWVDSGGIGHWESTGTIALSAGRNAITLSASRRRPSGSNCNQQETAMPATRVAAPYVANDASGPVESLTVINSGVRLGSMEQNSNATLSIRVGLIPPLEVAAAWDDPPIYLRITTNSSQTQAVDCDDSNVSGPAGNHSNFRNEIEDGCFTFYAPNTRNGDCSNYGTGSLPPSTTRSDPIDDCVITQTGVSSGQIRQAIDNRFGRSGGGPGTPCKTLNNWPQSASDPYPDPLTDGRYIVLFIVDQTAFQSSGNQIYPVRNFGGFYLTGGDGLNCPGDDPPPPGTRQASAWGHFLNYVTPNPDAEPSENLCAFDEVGVCIALLVE